MEKRRGGQELTADERALMRKVFQAAAASAAARVARGGGGRAARVRRLSRAAACALRRLRRRRIPRRRLPRRLRLGRRRPRAAEAGRGARAAVANYQFGGDYWVIALRNNQPVPVAVRTGLTDLDYSEVVSGLKPGDRVLLLPSASLFEQQERLQQFISPTFRRGSPFQQNQAAAARRFRCADAFRYHLARAEAAAIRSARAHARGAGAGARPAACPCSRCTAGSTTPAASICSRRRLPGCEIVALDLAGHGLSGFRSPDASYNIWEDVGDRARSGRAARLGALQPARSLARRRDRDAVRRGVPRARGTAGAPRRRRADRRRRRRRARDASAGVARSSCAASARAAACSPSARPRSRSAPRVSRRSRRRRPRSSRGARCARSTAASSGTPISG